ncbi:MAG: phosphatidylglycerophosphatase A, partial [Deltaproteobacteria bacterium]|nr:phosphatidylglycerophosphatase A [Deltaproteobacteria bacterium]
MSASRSDNLTVRESFLKADFIGKSALCLGTGFGVGLAPKASGTFGTLAALPLVFFAHALGAFSGAIFLLFFFLIAIWASEQCRRHLKREDPREVVIDEAAGFLLSLYGLPLSWQALLTGFLLFRFFDILKPYPIGRLERIRGGAGIVLDDLLAGLWANLGTRALLLLLSL